MNNVASTTHTPEQVVVAETIPSHAGTVQGTALFADPVVPAFVPNSPQMITITPEQYAQFQRAVREGFVAKRVNEMGNEYTSRRNTLILRKVGKLYPNLVSDEEVVAYYDIYKMREAVLGDAKKVQVKDDEVSAYLELWTGENTPSLEAIENLIAKNSLG